MPSGSEPVKCPKCKKKISKVSGQAYDNHLDIHYRINLARVCKHCKIIYMNPSYKDKFEIIWDEIGK